MKSCSFPRAAAPWTPARASGDFIFRCHFLELVIRVSIFGIWFWGLQALKEFHFVGGEILRVISVEDDLFLQYQRRR